MKPVIKVSTHKWLWFEFMLQSWHYYGEDNKGLFVTSDISCAGRMSLYRTFETGNSIGWRRVIEPESSQTVKAIRAFQAKHPKPFEQTHETIRAKLNRQRITPAELNRQRITPPVPMRKTPKTWVDVLCGLA